MEQNKLIPDFERFKANHPEIDPAAFNFMGAPVTDSEEAVFTFVMSYIFM